MADIQVEDAHRRHRFEATDGEEILGVALYERENGAIVLTHTVVEPSAEGRGVGSALARTALDTARAEGLRVVPRCTFMAGWIKRHPEYADLVD